MGVELERASSVKTRVTLELFMALQNKQRALLFFLLGGRHAEKVGGDERRAPADEAIHIIYGAKTCSVAGRDGARVRDAHAATGPCRAL